MSELKIGVVEDELVIARTIIHTLEELGYAHCGPAINYTEAIEMLQQDAPDLLLLDIQLSGKKDGIDVAEKLNAAGNIPFIFLTANSDADTIERAKSVRPHAYIVKPFNKQELFAAIEIAFSNFSDRHQPKEKAAPAAKDHLFVRDGYIFRKVFFSELLYLESDANYLVLHLKSHRKIMVRSTLNDFITQLDARSFVRVHRSFCINIHLVDDVAPTEITVSENKIPVGRSYRDDLLKMLGITDAPEQ